MVLVRGVGVACFILAAAVVSLGVVPQAQEPPAVTSATPSVGTIALLAAAPSSPEGTPLLRAGLGSPDARVRAAAARVALGLGTTSVVRDLLSAVGAETDGEAAAEIARALVVLGNGVGDVPALEAARRLGAPVAAVVGDALARTRPAVLAGAASSLASGSEHTPVGEALALGYLGSPAVRELLAQTALQGARTWGAFLRALREAGELGPAAQIAEACLAADEQVRAATFWHVAFFATNGVAVPDAVRTAMDKAPEANDDARSPAAFARELTARGAGWPARRRSAWPTWIGAWKRDAISLADLPSPVRQRLARGEKRALGRLLETDFDTPSFDRLDFALDSRPGVIVAPVRTGAPHPTGFEQAVETAAGCDPNDLAIFSARIVYRPDGRVARAALRAVPPSAACKTVMHALLATLVAPRFRPTRPEGEEIAFLEAGRTGCAPGPSAPPVPLSQLTEGPPASGGHETIYEDSRRITPPSKVRHITPRYPPALITQRIQGVVVIEATIDAGGCVTGAEVLRHLVPELDEEALSAVLRWRYTPTLLDGTPVPVVVTATVNFSLQ